MQIHTTVGCPLFLCLFNHVKAVVVTLVNPFVKLFFPGCFFCLDGGVALGLIRITGQRSTCDKPGKCLGRCLCITMYAHGNFLHKTQVGVIGLNLNNLGVLWPVVQAVLRQRSKGTHT